MIGFRQFFRGVFVAALALWAGLANLLAPPAALAQLNSFSLQISEREAAISQPENTALQDYLMWDLGSDRVVARNSPYLQLTNNSSAPIVEFRMTIGDERFNFNCTMLQSCAFVSSAPSGLGVTSSVIAGNELVLSFANGGLAMDQFVRFRIALGVDEGYNFFHLPDFRTVLFDMNGNNVYNGSVHLPNGESPTDDNSMVTVKFGPNGASGIVGPVPFEDFVVTSQSANYYNNLFRRYGVMEPVETFVLLGQGAIVPEPSTAVLALAALGGGAAMARRRRPLA